MTRGSSCGVRDGVDGNSCGVDEATGVWRTVARVLLGLALLGAGAAHLTFARSEFQAQVPSWMPGEPDLVVVVSGIVELLLGAALVSGWRRHAVGWIVAGFFVVIFPGNIAQYVEGTDMFGLDTDRERFVRLWFQPVLIVAALWSTGAWRRWRERG